MQVQSLPRMIIKEEIGEQVIIPWHFPIKIYFHLNTHFNQILIKGFIWMLVELYSLHKRTSHIIPLLFLEISTNQDSCKFYFGCGNEIYSIYLLDFFEQVRYSLEAAKFALSNVSAGFYDASAGML